MKLYVASKHQDKAANLRMELLRDGHEVTSRWITNDEKFGGNPEDYTFEERRALALADEEDVRAADDGLILISDPKGFILSGGKHVETGIAIALKRRIYVIGRRENIFHFHPLVELFDNAESLREVLRERSAAAR